MPHVEELPSGRWRGVYRLASGKKRSKTFDHKRAAARWAAAQEEQVAHGRTRDPAIGRLPFGVWCLEWWWPSRTIVASTERSQRAKRDRHVLPRWEDVPLNQITHLDVQTWARSLSRSGLAAATVRQCVGMVSAALREAVRAGHLDVNPAQGVRLPSLPPAPERYLSHDETEALLEALAHPDPRRERPGAAAKAWPGYRVLGEILLETGARIGEAVVLHRHRVDFDARTIDLVESWENNQRVIRGHTKHGHRRTVPMTDRLEQVLRDHLADEPAAARCGFTHESGSGCRSGLVVVGPAGGVIDPTNFTTRVFGRALRDAGIGHCRVHDLRHTWASRLVTAGVSIQRVQRWAGHGSLVPTQRYAHLMDEGHDEYRDALGRGAGYAAERGASRGAEQGTARLRVVP